MVVPCHQILWCKLSFYNKFCLHVYLVVLATSAAGQTASKADIQKIRPLHKYLVKSPKYVSGNSQKKL